MDILDPHEITHWGMGRFIMSSELILDDIQGDMVKAGKTEGISVADQIRHETNELDTEEWEELDRMKKELKATKEKV